MRDLVTILAGLVVSLAGMALMAAWFAVLPTIGLLWLAGWLP